MVQRNIHSRYTRRRERKFVMSGIAPRRILLLNPNSGTARSEGIDAAIAPFRSPSGPALAVATIAGGPPGIYAWADWHAAAAREALATAGRTLAAQGAGALIPGRTGMARHRAALERQLGLPVIEPSQAATARALGILPPA
jgi:Asp/Glu/hydantoin racemase